MQPKVAQPMKVLLTGASGRIGRHAAHAIARHGGQVRGLSRRAYPSVDGSSPNIEYVIGSLADNKSLRSAMEGTNAAVLIAPNGEQQYEQETQFVDMAMALGVSRIIKLSSIEASESALSPIARQHFAVERYLEERALQWTVLRPTLFMQTFALFSDRAFREGKLLTPFADASIAPVDCADIGEAIAIVLKNKESVGKRYCLTGFELLSLTEIASIFSSEAGRSIIHIDQSIDNFREDLARLVSNEWTVDAIAALFEGIRRGHLGGVHNDLETLLGRRPLSFRNYLKRETVARGGATSETKPYAST